MAIDEERRKRTVEAIDSAGLQALAGFTPADVLLLTGYWPVMGASLAVATRWGDLACIVPEDELELARATSNAEFIPYKPHSLKALTCAAEAMAEMIHANTVGDHLDRHHAHPCGREPFQEADAHARGDRRGARRGAECGPARGRRERGRQGCPRRAQAVWLRRRVQARSGARSGLRRRRSERAAADPGNLFGVFGL